MVAGLEQNTAGRISIGDRVVSDAAAGFFVPPDHRQLGMVFQSYAIWPHMTVFDNVAYPLRIRRRPKAEINDRVHSVLRLVEMESSPIARRRRFPAASSSASRLRARWCSSRRCCCSTSRCRNLDARLRTQMGDEFRALQKRLGITSLYVTHDQEEAMALSDRVVVMQGGRILQVGAPEEIYQRPTSRAVAAFFGSPNLLNANVTACERRADKRFALGVAGEDWTGHCLAAESFNNGEPVLVLVRPENVHIGKDGSNGSPMAWSGRIKSSIFRGPRQSIVVETAGLALNVEAPALLSARVGDEVHLNVPPLAAWAIRPDGTSSAHVR